MLLQFIETNRAESTECFVCIRLKFLRSHQLLKPK